MHSKHPPFTKVITNWPTADTESSRLETLLLTPNRNTLSRFCHFYHHLSALPQHIWRKIKRKTALTLASTAFMLALSGVPIAQAANISITPGAAGFIGDGQCSIVEAIANANNDMAIYPDCAAGSGHDTITLSGNTYSYSAALGTSGTTALPDITSTITIEAAGATLERAMGAPKFRILKITGANANLTLNQATVSGGHNEQGFGSGGGGISIENNATATIKNSTVSKNSTDEVGGGGIANEGTLTLMNSTISGNTSGLDSFSDGGGIYNNGTLTIMDSTLTDNYASHDGGGFHNNGTVTISHSIVSGNRAFGGDEITRSSDSGSITGNLNLLGHSGRDTTDAFLYYTPAGSSIIASSDGTTPTELTDILNTTLADNAGSTHTHALVSGSPAIDAHLLGATCVAGELDQRGGQRANGAAHGGGACDLGAYEFDSMVGTSAPTAIRIQTLGNEPATPWLLASIGSLLTTISALVLQRKHHSTTGTSGKATSSTT